MHHSAIYTTCCEIANHDGRISNLEHFTNYTTGGRTFQKVVRRNDFEEWIELFSKKVVSVYQKSVLYPENLVLNAKYKIK